MFFKLSGAKKVLHCVGGSCSTVEVGSEDEDGGARHAIPEDFLINAARNIKGFASPRAASNKRRLTGSKWCANLIHEERADRIRSFEL